MRRDNYLDISKGIGIIFVVLIHSAMLSSEVTSWINEFYMPMFFCVSGYVIGKYGKLTSTAQLKKSVIKFLMEYFETCILLYVIRVAIAMVLNHEMIPSWKAIFSTFFGRFFDSNNSYIVDEYWTGHLWFLTAMIASYVVMFWAIKVAQGKVHRLVIEIVVLLLVAQLFRKAPILLPWCIDIVPVLCSFMLLSYIVASKDFAGKRVNLSILLADIICCVLVIAFHDNYDIHLRNYGQHTSIIGVLMFYIAAIAGSWLLVRFSSWIDEIKGLNTILRYIGRNSIGIFLWHIFWIFVFKTVFNVVNCPLLIEDIIIVIGVIVMSLLTYRCIQRCLQFFRKNLGSIKKVKRNN